MTLLLDTSTAPAGDRARSFEAALSTATLPVRVHADPGITARFEFWEPGAGVDVTRHTTSGYRITRTARHVRLAAPERAALAVTVSGDHRLAQGELQWAGPPGGLRLLDLTSPYDLVAAGPCTALSLQIDVDRLALPVDVVRRAVPRLERSPLHDMVRRHLQALPDALAAVASPTARAALVHATTELARALIASAGDDGHLATAAAAESLLTRVTTYVEQHLGEPDLDLARIAAANSISLRHLHALFAARGERPAEWMWRRRLEEAHRELARRAADRPAVAAVARRWGFSDPAHFSRRFRAAYGTTPREWVRANQPGADGAPR